MDAQIYCAEKLADAKARMAVNHQICEETATLSTPEGIRKYDLARALHESDRKQVLYWTTELEKASGVNRAA